MGQLKCLGQLHWKKMCQIPRCGETEKRSGVKHHCDGHRCIAQYKLSETLREKQENTNEETLSMWKGCYRTFRAIPALSCRASVDNTATQNNYMATYKHLDTVHSSQFTALTHLRVVKMWAGIVIFKESYFKWCLVRLPGKEASQC